MHRQYKPFSLLYMRFCWWILWLPGLLWLTGCDSNEYARDLSEVPAVSMPVRRLDQELFALKTKDDIFQFLNANAELAEAYFQRSKFPHDSILIGQIHAFLQVKANDTLQQDVQKVFGDAAGLQKDIEQAYRHLRYYYPDAPVPQLCTMVSGFGTFGFGYDLFVSDKYLVIGLDYFVGKEGTYRPQGVPNYILRRYEPAYIVPGITRLLSDKYNQTDMLDRTLLGQMVAHGKALYFSKSLLPAVPDSLIIGYSDQDMADVQHNEATIYAHFVDNNLLYNNTLEMARDYIQERPYTLEIADKCPGRIGQWIGWRIVETYARRQDQRNLGQIMAVKDARVLFAQSKYKPEKR